MSLPPLTAIERKGRYWRVMDMSGDKPDLICLTVYKRGARRVAEILDELRQGQADYEEGEYLAELNRGYAHDRR